MSTTSRAASQQSQYSRRRSNTAQSILRPLPPAPLSYGDTKVLNSWVHDTKECPTVIFNQSYWPGVCEGDMLSLTSGTSCTSSGFLFIVPKDDGCSKPQLQVPSANMIIPALCADAVPPLRFRCPSPLPMRSGSGITPTSLSRRSIEVLGI